MKQYLCTVVGVLGATAAWAFGGWDTALVALLICMGVDYVSGSVVALVFHKSTKTETGAYNSAYGIKGLCKKGLTLLFVLAQVGVLAGQAEKSASHYSHRRGAGIFEMQVYSYFDRRGSGVDQRTQNSCAQGRGRFVHQSCVA